MVAVGVTNVLLLAAWILGRKYGWISKYIISLVYLWQTITRIYIMYKRIETEEETTSQLEFIALNTLYIAY